MVLTERDAGALFLSAGVRSASRANERVSVGTCVDGKLRMGDGVKRACTHLSNRPQALRASAVVARGSTYAELERCAMRCDAVGPKARGRRRERGKGFLSRHQWCERPRLPTFTAAGFVTSGLQRGSVMASRKLARIGGILLRRAHVVLPGRSGIFTQVVAGQDLAQTKLEALSGPALLGEPRGCFVSGATGYKVWKSAAAWERAVSSGFFMVGRWEPGRFQERWRGREL